MIADDIVSPGDIGKTIGRMRKERRYTQAKAAGLVGVRQQVWSKWERGINLPNMENQLRIAKLFDVSLDDLHGRTGSQPVAVQDYTRAVCAACTSCFCEVPVTGLGYPDDRGWYNPLQLPVYVPRPPGYPNAVNMIAVLAINCSMEPDGIRPGYVAYCDFAKPPDPRDAVFIKAIDGKVTVKRFIRHEGDGLLLVGWTEPDDDGFQQPYSELCPNDFIDTMASVVLVKRK